MKTIKVSIDALGNPTIATEGFKGSECLAATAAIERLYGKREAYTETSEMHEMQEVDQTVQLGGGY